MVKFDEILVAIAISHNIYTKTLSGAGHLLVSNFRKAAVCSLDELHDSSVDVLVARFRKCLKLLVRGQRFVFGSKAVFARINVLAVGKLQYSVDVMIFFAFPTLRSTLCATAAKSEGPKFMVA